jgi:hypothetical protein
MLQNSDEQRKLLVDQKVTLHRLATHWRKSGFWLLGCRGQPGFPGLTEVAGCVAGEQSYLTCGAYGRGREGYMIKSTPGKID